MKRFSGPSCPLPAGTDANLAAFFQNLSYPPARSRRPDDVLSLSASDGFADFFLDQGGAGGPATCADTNSGCHSLPLGNSTCMGIPGETCTVGAFDAPTMRGMTDRFVQFSNGLTSPEQILAGAGATRGSDSRPRAARCRNP